jgi:hypothetical protein
MDWVSPWVIVPGVAVVAFSILIGRMRRQTPWIIALDTSGYVLFSFGLFLASNLGGQALFAAGAASLGALMFTTAYERHRTAKKIRESGGLGSVGAE